MSAEKTFNGLPGWAKGVVAVAVIGGIGISAYLIYKKIKARNASANSRKEIDEVNKEINDQIKKGVKPTLTPSQIAAMANALQTAMDGYGTDYGAVLNQLVKLRNDLDILALNKSFGVRKINSGRGNPAADFEGTLGQCLTDELSDTRIGEVNMMLAKKGIKFRY